MILLTKTHTHTSSLSGAYVCTFRWRSSFLSKTGDSLSPICFLPPGCPSSFSEVFLFRDSGTSSMYTFCASACGPLLLHTPLTLVSWILLPYSHFLPLCGHTCTRMHTLNARTLIHLRLYPRGLSCSSAEHSSTLIAAVYPHLCSSFLSCCLKNSLGLDVAEKTPIFVPMSHCTPLSHQLLMQLRQACADRVFRAKD